MSVVGGRERLALLCLAGVKGGSGLEFQLNTSYMDEDILISANKPFNATQILGVPRKNLLNRAGRAEEKSGKVYWREFRYSARYVFRSFILFSVHLALQNHHHHQVYSGVQKFPARDTTYSN